MKLKNIWKKIEDGILPFYFGAIYSLGLIFGAKLIIVVLKSTINITEILEDSTFLVIWGILFLANLKAMDKSKFRKNINKTSLILLIIILITFGYKYLIK